MSWNTFPWMPPLPDLASDLKIRSATWRETYVAMDSSSFKGRGAPSRSSRTRCSSASALGAGDWASLTSTANPSAGSVEAHIPRPFTRTPAWNVTDWITNRRVLSALTYHAQTAESLAKGRRPKGSTQWTPPGAYHGPILSDKNAPDLSRCTRPKGRP